MNPEDYSIEQCYYCDSYVAVRSHGVTACPRCGKPVLPCNVCYKEQGGCEKNCPYGLRWGEEPSKIPITNPPMTKEEIAFAEENCR